MQRLASSQLLYYPYSFTLWPQEGAIEGPFQTQATGMRLPKITITWKSLFSASCNTFLIHILWCPCVEHDPRCDDCRRPRFCQYSVRFVAVTQPVFSCIQLWFASSHCQCPFHHAWLTCKQPWHCIYTSHAIKSKLNAVPVKTSFRDWLVLPDLKSMTYRGKHARFIWESAPHDHLHFLSMSSNLPDKFLSAFYLHRHSKQNLKNYTQRHLVECDTTIVYSWSTDKNKQWLEMLGQGRRNHLKRDTLSHYVYGK